MILRLGKRWGWANGRGVTQRESESVSHFGTADMSFRDELAQVAQSWRTGQVATNDLHPATFSEARAVIELLEELYARMR
jgi:hypothetical protein